MSKNSDIQQVFNHWNSAKIVVHKVLDKLMKRVIVSVLDDYEIEDILVAISNYAEIVKDDNYYWTHKWRLEQFLKQENGFRNFLPETEPFKKYTKAGYSNGSGNTTPPVLPVSPAFKEEFLKRKQEKMHDKD